ncbi:MAG TPA: PAS domain S-box protein, partial [Holophaga sp.]|nr:PAS domain S-box protein [Holophaga sp.]
MHASSAPDRHFLALGTLTEILAGTDDADALFTRALEVVRGAVDLPASAVLLLDPAGEMRLRVGTAMPGELLEMALARWPSSCADPDPAVLDESGPDEAFGSLLRAAGLRSLLLFPLRCGGRTLGCCVFGSGSDRPLTPGGMQFVRSAANLLGCAAQRTGQAAGPTRSAAFTEHLLETAHLIIVGLDAHGRVVIFNEAAELAMNLRKGDVLGQDWFKMAIPQERRTARRASFARFLETGAPREVEATLLVRGGQERLIAWRNTRFHEPGTDLAVLCFGIDVTEARRSTEALKASEERFSRVFHMSPDAIDLTRLEDGVCLDCNQSYLNLYGYAREEVIGHSTLPGDLGIWERGEDRARHVAELLDTGHAFDFETTLRRRDGRTLVGLIASSVIEVDGQPCNLSLTRDITERKRTEEVLRESARRLELALASNHLGIWDRDLRDDTEIWDDRMYGIYGLEPGALRPDFTTWIERIVLPEDAAQLASDVGEALAGKRPYDLQFRIVRPDGAVRHVASHGMVVRDAAGKAVRVIGINQDRTEQEDAERERRRLQIEAHHAEKLESLGSLAGGVAHDMNNVLTAILVMAEILRDRFQLDGAAIRSIETILHAGQRGRDLVKALTDFARKDLDAIVPIDLNELLRKEVDLLRH